MKRLSPRRRVAQFGGFSLIGCLAVAAALVFVGVTIERAVPRLHNPFGSTPTTGTAAVKPATYRTVGGSMPCGQLQLVDVLAGSSTTNNASLLGASMGWLGKATINALYPVQFAACIKTSGIGIRTRLHTQHGRTSASVSVPQYHPQAGHIDDVSPVVCDGLKPEDGVAVINKVIRQDYKTPLTSCDGGLAVGGILGATPTEVGNALHLSRELADISADLSPLPVALQRKIIASVESAARPELLKLYKADTLTFETLTVESGFAQMSFDWRTFGPEIMSNFSHARFSEHGKVTELALSGGVGGGGTVMIEQPLTASQIRDLNAIHLKPAPVSTFTSAEK